MGRLDKSNQNRGRGLVSVAVRILIGLWMAGVAAASFLYLPPAKNFAVPEAAKMIILHVPCAMIAVVAYLVSTAYAIIYLMRADAASDIKSAASARLGFIFTLLATVTGMIFAKIQWGAAWNWDPRETSILMLLFVYAAYFALRGAIPAFAVRARVSAVYNVIACLVMPYLVFVLPRMMPGLHPNDTLSHRSALSMDYRIVLAASMLGFLFTYLCIFRSMVRIGESRYFSKKMKSARSKSHE